MLRKLRCKHYIRFELLCNLMNHELAFYRMKVATEEIAK